MKQIIVNVPDAQLPFFKELIDKLGWQSNEANPTELPEWQKKELDRRLEAIKKGEMKMIPWEEFDKEDEG